MLFGNCRIRHSKERLENIFELLKLVKVGVKTKVLVEKGWRDMLLERMSVGALENHLEQLAGRMFVMPKKEMRRIIS